MNEFIICSNVVAEFSAESSENVSENLSYIFPSFLTSFDLFHDTHIYYLLCRDYD